MTITVAHIWRHPLKSHGREELDRVTLTAGETMPWDRAWAVAHEAAKTDGTAWAECVNFTRGAKSPQLMAINATLNETAETLTLTHPDKAPLTFRPDHDAAAFLAWSNDLTPAERAQSARIIRVAGRGMTDTPFPSVSFLNLSSNRALGQRLNTELDMRRWRGNFWLDGMGPWQEFEWIGKTLSIGAAEIKISERITRCLATTANPETGVRDADTLGALKSGYDHQDFGVYGQVIKSGAIAAGDQVHVK